MALIVTVMPTCFLCITMMMTTMTMTMHGYAPIITHLALQDYEGCKTGLKDLYGSYAKSDWADWTGVPLIWALGGYGSILTNPKWVG